MQTVAGVIASTVGAIAVAMLVDVRAAYLTFAQTSGSAISGEWQAMAIVAGTVAATTGAVAAVWKVVSGSLGASNDAVDTLREVIRELRDENDSLRELLKEARDE